MLNTLEDVLTFLDFYFLSSFNKLFIHRHWSNASGDTLTDCFKTITNSSYKISCKENSSFDDTEATLDWPLDKSFSRLINNFPGSLRKHANKHIRVSKEINRPQNFINSFDELLKIEIHEFMLDFREIGVFFGKSWKSKLCFWNIWNCDSKGW